MKKYLFILFLLLPATAFASTTWNPADDTVNIQLSNSNLTMTNLANGWNGARATISKSSGKWYWEITMNNDVGGAGDLVPGITAGTTVIAGPYFYLQDSYGYNGANGNKRANGVDTAYGATYTTGDVIGVAYDADNGTITFYKNCTSQGVAFTGISGTYFPVMGQYDNGNQSTVNFGLTSFACSIPAGFSSFDGGGGPPPPAATSTPPFEEIFAATGSSTNVFSIVDNPTQDLYNGFMLFFVSGAAVIWVFRKRK